MMYSLQSINGDTIEGEFPPECVVPDVIFVGLIVFVRKAFRKMPHGDTVFYQESLAYRLKDGQLCLTTP